jgi:hypothetical protein
MAREHDRPNTCHEEIDLNPVRLQSLDLRKNCSFSKAAGMILLKNALYQAPPDFGAILSSTPSN